ncbi:hypothetical protein Pfo_013592 [Paulownia fortunei]|nr:hypothetical protein Pfo_013592 [Paulownia fortunei]
MDVGSPENGYDDINDFLRDDDSTFADDLDLDLVVNKDIAEDYVYSDSAVNDKFHLDLSEQEKRELPSLPSSFRYYDVPGSPSENFCSYLQSGFHHGTLGERDIVGDPEKFQIQYNENLHHDDTEKLSSSYFHDSIFQMDSESTFHEIQNDVSAHPQELVSMQDANLQYILDKPASPANNEIGEHAYVEAVQNELAQSECVHRDTDEEVPVHQIENLCFSPVSHLRDPETKCEKIESINSPSRCKEFEPSRFDQRNHGRSLELYKSSNTDREALGSPNISDSSYQSPGIHELPALQPNHQIVSKSASSNKQTPSPPNKRTPSPKECNEGKAVPPQDHNPHAEPLISASSHGLRLISQHLENSPAEHVTTLPRSHCRVDREILQSSVRRQKSSSIHKMDYRNRSYSMSPPHSKNYNQMSLDLGPVSQSLRSQKLCPLHEGLAQLSSSSKSSLEKYASRSPCPINSVAGSLDATSHHRSLKSQNSSASQGVVPPSSSSRICRQKDGPAKRPNHRRSRSRSQKVSSVEEGVTQLPSSSRSVEHKCGSLMTPQHNGSQSRSPHTRYHHKRPLDTAPTEQLSRRRKIFALQGPVLLSSLSGPGKQKHALDDKFNYYGSLSRSPCSGDCHKRSFHADSSAGRSLSSQRESALQGDHALSSSSRSVKKKPGSTEMYKGKRSRSRSPYTGDCNKKQMETALCTRQFSSCHKVSVPLECLFQPYESAERSNLGKEFSSNNPIGHRNSASPQSSRQRSKNSSSTRAPELPKSHCTHHNHRRRGRSISPSHIRRKDFATECKGGNRNKSPSKSSYRRDNGRSPRKRRSPSSRSPPSYHSLRSTPRRTHWSPPHERSTGLGKPGRSLFVAGFSFITTEKDLERKFSRFGYVRNVRIVRDKRSGDSRGFGFLTLERDEQADAAIRALDKTEWEGRIVLVEKSKSR